MLINYPIKSTIEMGIFFVIISIALDLFGLKEAAFIMLGMGLVWIIEPVCTKLILKDHPKAYYEAMKYYSDKAARKQAAADFIGMGESDGKMKPHAYLLDREHNTLTKIEISRRNYEYSRTLNEIEKGQAPAAALEKFTDQDKYIKYGGIPYLIVRGGTHPPIIEKRESAPEK
jgi:hypothetical protein